MRLHLLGCRSLIPVLAVAAASAAHAQIASDDFETGNPNGWGVEFTRPGTQMPMGGNPGGSLNLTIANTMSNLPAAMIVPADPAHPYRGNLRALGAAEFRFDREVVGGSSNFGTLPFLVIGNDGGTPNDFMDDAWLFTATGDNFQFGSRPYATIVTPIPASSTTLPAMWAVQVFSGNPAAGQTDDAVWDAIIQDVSYIGIAMNRPFNGGDWFGQHELNLDNFVLDFGDNLGTNYCGPAATNSAGLQGEILVIGSPVAAQNALELVAQSLPNFSFGFFLAGPTQDLVPNPGGSEGNLCLGGLIGRYVGNGQIQNSGSSGRFSLPLDLTNVPTPNGFVALTAGQTWNFQAWHRDSSPVGSTSNLTDALSLVLQ